LGLCGADRNPLGYDSPMPAIERWFRLEWMEHTPPFYTSVDIRNAGFKLAPVDTNLYPGGWNNLTPEMLPLAVQAAMAAIEKICPEAKNLLVIPENHTRNTFYLSNVVQLQRIFHMAGLNVRVGSINPDIKQPTKIDLPNGESVVLEPVVRSRRRLGLKDFDPCTILLNNDLTAGARAATSRATRKWPSASARCSASTRG
jgi:glutamate--cysteine ligase